MNSRQKIVFSKTLAGAGWNNTRLVKGDLAAEIRKLEEKDRKGMTILGSGNIVSQLAEERLIDGFQIVLNPVALGNGRSLFAGIRKSLKCNQRLPAPSRMGASCYATSRFHDGRTDETGRG